MLCYYYYTSQIVESRKKNQNLFHGFLKNFPKTHTKYLNQNFIETLVEISVTYLLPALLKFKVTQSVDVKEHTIFFQFHATAVQEDYQFVCYPPTNFHDCCCFLENSVENCHDSYSYLVVRLCLWVENMANRCVYHHPCHASVN